MRWWQRLLLISAAITSLAAAIFWVAPPDPLTEWLKNPFWSRAATAAVLFIAIAVFLAILGLVPLKLTLLGGGVDSTAASPDMGAAALVQQVIAFRDDVAALARQTDEAAALIDESLQQLRNLESRVTTLERVTPAAERGSTSNG